jgi:hypothetical protein
MGVVRSSGNASCSVRRRRASRARKAIGKASAIGKAHASATARVPNPEAMARTTSTGRRAGFPMFSTTTYGVIVPKPRVAESATLDAAARGRKGANIRR